MLLSSFTVFFLMHVDRSYISEMSDLQKTAPFFVAQKPWKVRFKKLRNYYKLGDR